MPDASPRETSQSLQKGASVWRSQEKPWRRHPEDSKKSRQAHRDTHSPQANMQVLSYPIVPCTSHAHRQAHLDTSFSTGSVFTPKQWKGTWVACRRSIPSISLLKVLELLRRSVMRNSVAWWDPKEPLPVSIGNTGQNGAMDGFSAMLLLCWYVLCLIHV